MTELTKYKKVFSDLPSGADWAEVNIDSTDEYIVRFQNGVQSGCELYAKNAVYLQASNGQSTGIVYTENTDDDPRTLIEEALKCAQYSGREAYTPLKADASVCCVHSCEPEDILAYGESLCLLAKNIPDIRGFHFTVRRTDKVRQVCNSLGLSSQHSSTYYLIQLAIELKNGAVSSLVRSASSLQKLPAQQALADAVQKAELYHGVSDLKQLPLSSGSYRCVLSADVLCNILITAWQEFTAANLECGVSAFQKYFASNQAIGSPVLNITDAPSHPGWGYELKLDSQGCVIGKKSVVKNGILTEPLRTLYDSAPRRQAPGGNAGRAALLSGTAQVNIVTIPNIIYVEPGKDSVESLLASLDTGLFITRSMDEFHSINISSGNFSIPCGGLVYEKGKPIGTTGQITIVGSLRDLLMSVQAVGNDLQFDEFIYHNYCFGGPSLLIENISVSSGS